MREPTGIVRDEFLGLKERGFVWDSCKPDGQPRCCLDTTRAERLFGFKAKMQFEEGLQRTIRWHEQARAGAGVAYKL